MRKDVKFVMGICALLLALLIIYVLFVPSENAKGPQVAGTGATGSGATSGTSTGAGSSATHTPSTPATQESGLTLGGTGSYSATQPLTGYAGGATTQPAPGATDVAIGGPATQPAVASGSIASDPFANRTTPATVPSFGGSETAHSGMTGAATGTTPTAVGSDTRNVDWGRILETGQYATAQGGSNSGSTPRTGSSFTSGSTPAFGSGSLGSGSSAAGAGSTGSSLTGGARTHVVAAGETLTSIAQAEYGDGNLYTKILTANPKLDPRRMKVGQKLVIPDRNAAAATPASTGTDTASGATGSTGSTPKAPRTGTSASAGGLATGTGKTYTVQTGDSLQKIAYKTLGSTAKWEQIYQLNKSKIGSNPAHIKVGQTLQIPSGASSETGSPAAGSTSTRGSSSRTPSTPSGEVFSFSTPTTNPAR